MKKLLLVLLLLISGCHLNKINRLEHLSSQRLLKNKDHRSIDSILRKYFTEKSYNIIRDIPTLNGPGLTAHVIGFDFISSLWGTITLNGPWRAVILTKEDVLGQNNNLISILIHEYMHHLDDIDRDGDHELFDHKEFEKAYMKMYKDTDKHGFLKYKGYIIKIESLIMHNAWFTNIFGVGVLSEHIANVAEDVALRPHLLPKYMLDVFKNILRQK